MRAARDARMRPALHQWFQRRSGLTDGRKRRAQGRAIDSIDRMIGAARAVTQGQVRYRLARFVLSTLVRRLLLTQSRRPE